MFHLSSRLLQFSNSSDIICPELMKPSGWKVQCLQKLKNKPFCHSAVLFAITCVTLMNYNFMLNQWSKVLCIFICKQDNFSAELFYPCLMLKLDIVCDFIFVHVCVEHGIFPQPWSYVRSTVSTMFWPSPYCTPCCYWLYIHTALYTAKIWRYRHMEHLLPTSPI